MSKEAMKLALGALSGSWRTEEEKNALREKQIQAILALREALAQQALDKKAENARELGLDYEPAQQEPVAWMFQHGETGRTLCVDALQVKWGFEGRNPSYQKIAPLYISPPAQPMHPEIKKMYEDYFDKCFRESSAPQRTWVGLTDEEIEKLTVELRDIPVTLAFAIEAKLRSKNEDRN